VFWSPEKKTIAKSERFKIFLFVPEASKPYFFSKSDLKSIQTLNVNIETDLISNLPHGFRTKCLPASKSLFYTSPFFLKFRTPLITSSNYLVYKSSYKPNSEECILSMVTYNNESDTLLSEFSPQVSFPFKHHLKLNNVLEFILIDSNNQQLLVEDGSFLFFILTVH